MLRLKLPRLLTLMPKLPHLSMLRLKLLHLSMLRLRLPHLLTLRLKLPHLLTLRLRHFDLHLSTRTLMHDNLNQIYLALPYLPFHLYK